MLKGTRLGPPASFPGSNVAEYGRTKVCSRYLLTHSLELCGMGREFPLMPLTRGYWISFLQVSSTWLSIHVSFLYPLHIS